MNKQETDLYNELFETLTQSLPQETLIIYLTLPLSELKKRIVERNRTFEVQHFTDEYLLNLEESIKSLVQHVEKNIPVLRIDEKSWFDIVSSPEDQKSIVSKIQSCLKK